jgi:hypothetical protein
MSAPPASSRSATASSAANSSSGVSPLFDQDSGWSNPRTQLYALNSRLREPPALIESPIHWIALVRENGAMPRLISSSRRMSSMLEYSEGSFGCRREELSEEQPGAIKPRLVGRVVKGPPLRPQRPTPPRVPSNVVVKGMAGLSLSPRGVTVARMVLEE